MPHFDANHVLDFGKFKAYFRLGAGLGRIVPHSQAENILQKQLRLEKQRIGKEQRETKRPRTGVPEDSTERHARARQQLSSKLLPHKLRLLDVAVEQFDAHTFADLGCAWGVDGGYGLYCLDELKAKHVTLVDAFGGNERLLAFVAARPHAQFINSGFGSPSVAQEVGEVDAVILYDVLLHQVSPDWDDILKLYAPNVRMFVIYNQQWTGSETVRLLDLGEEEYLKNVPHSIDDGIYRKVLESPDDINPANGKPYRDASRVWQWGITDSDLIEGTRTMGFELKYWEDHGAAFRLPNFRNRSFLFVRKQA
jgi:hypothetical protein